MIRIHVEPRGEGQVAVVVLLGETVTLSGLVSTDALLRLRSPHADA